MKPKSLSKNELMKLCAELGPEDGIDPRDLFKANRKDSPRKAHQLCHQVAETLSIELASRTDAPVADLSVVRVEPAPDSSHLLVLVASIEPDRTLVEREVLAELDAMAGVLREEIARAITRRRVPTLTFRLLPYGTEGA